MASSHSASAGAAAQASRAYSTLRQRSIGAPRGDRRLQPSGGMGAGEQGVIVRCVGVGVGVGCRFVRFGHVGAPVWPHRGRGVVAGAACGVVPEVPATDSGRASRPPLRELREQIGRSRAPVRAGRIDRRTCAGGAGVQGAAPRGLLRQRGLHTYATASGKRLRPGIARSPTGARTFTTSRRAGSPRATTCWWWRICRSPT